MNIITTPGLLADSDLPFGQLTSIKSHGYEWISVQAQNDLQTVDFDSAAIKAVGLSPGVWGVTYSKASFFRDGKLLGQQAVRLGAEHVQMDAEECAKDTRSGQGMKPIIEGIRAGGWQWPVHLNTLGAPDNPDANDYAMDTKSFTDTGGGVLVQAYANDHLGYLPTYCARYWARMGLAPEQLNFMIGLYSGRLGRIDGSGWVPLLRDAGVRRNFSIFLAEHSTEADLAGLDGFSQPQPAAPAQPSTLQTRTAITNAARSWEAGRAPQSLSRINVCRRIASSDSDNTKWNVVSGAISKILDDAGFVP